MNCHSQVLKDSPKLALVRAAAADPTKPIPWLQIHKTPEFVYFNHSVHVNRGVSCVECHGQINKMDEVHEAKSFSMTFCLNCHRDPAAHLRPQDKITDLDWKAASPQQQREIGTNIMQHLKTQSLQSCSACHR
jgi:formate-dependent nitrite reductase cytochrome c552 subunit